MKGTIRRPFLAMLTLFGIIFALTMTTGALIVAFAETLSIDHTRKSFVDPNSPNFRFYYLQGNDHVDEVAVAWIDNYVLPPEASDSSDTSAFSYASENTSELVNPTTPETIVVPASANNGTSNFTVTAVAKTGFRYSLAKKIRLPETVKQIGEEAFYCCKNLEEFVIPYQVTSIPASAFMDCLVMVHLYYSAYTGSGATTYYTTGEGGYKTSNSTITSIGDHAFTSCKKLTEFSCPSSLREVGASAFQRCESLLTFVFPNPSGANDTITIGDYAFADCTALSLCYFDSHVSYVGRFAFAECENLRIYYGGAADDAVKDGDMMKSDGTTEQEYHAKWRKKHIATNKDDVVKDYVPLNPNTGKVIDNNSSYPGLSYVTVSGSAIKYEGYNPSTPKSLELESSSAAGKYIRILRFGTPTTDVAGYYETINGTGNEANITWKKVTIPNVIRIDNTDYKVKTIEPYAFMGNEDIGEIVFNQHLVQICKQSFYGCANIRKIDFSACEKLQEISYKVFQDGSLAANELVTSLKLPVCLKYVGTQAFYNFKKVSEFVIPYDASDSNKTSKLVSIGQQAFFNLGSDISGKGTAEITFPNTLQDYWNDQKLKPYRVISEDHDNAIMAQAFQGAKVLRSISMQWSSVMAGKKTHNAQKQSYRVGLGPSCFENCTSLERFTSNNCLYIMGSGAFNGCSSLKEMFLSKWGTAQDINDDGTEKNLNVSYNYTSTPWGIRGGKGDFQGSLFNASTCPDLVIYINETEYPRKNFEPTIGGVLWNTHGQIAHPYFSADTAKVLPTYPTYLGVGWLNLSTGAIDTNKVRYRTLDKIKDDGTVDNTNGSYQTYNYETPLIATNESPKTTFGTDVISYIEPTSNSYTITRAYCTANRTNIDLSVLTNESYFTKVGPLAFASNGGNNPGTGQITLPSGITEIGEYAFFRGSGRAVNKIIYSGGTAPSGNNPPSTYCVLPTVSIKRYAFYGNSFAYVDIVGLAFFGNTAFGLSGVSPSTSFTVGGSAFINDGSAIYSNANKTLMYLWNPTLPKNEQNQDVTQYDIAASTLAVAPHAFSNSPYTTVKAPASLAVLYGGAFQGNSNLQTFDLSATPAIKYIGVPTAIPAPDGVSTWSTGTFDAFDSPVYKDDYVHANSYYASSRGVFSGTSLTTFNFKSIASTLTFIGYGAFAGCSSLANMVNSGDVYNYYTYDGGKKISGNVQTSQTAAQTDQNSGVLDLTGCSLTSLGAFAFDGCSSIKYAHIPESNNFYWGTEGGTQRLSNGNPFNNKNKNIKILLGAKATVANKNAPKSTRQSARYPDSWLPDEVTYYYAASYSDILTTNSDSLKYWTPYNGGYLLIEGRAKAQTYFATS